MNKETYERLSAHELHEAAPEPLNTTIDDSEFERLERWHTEACEAVYQAALKAASICQLIGGESGSLFEDLDAIETWVKGQSNG